MATAATTIVVRIIIIISGLGPESWQLWVGMGWGQAHSKVQKEKNKKTKPLLEDLNSSK